MPNGIAGQRRERIHRRRMALGSELWRQVGSPAPLRLSGRFCQGVLCIAPPA